MHRELDADPLIQLVATVEAPCELAARKSCEIPSLNTLLSAITEANGPVAPRHAVCRFLAASGSRAAHRARHLNPWNAREMYLHFKCNCTRARQNEPVAMVWTRARSFDRLLAQKTRGTSARCKQARRLLLLEFKCLLLSPSA